MEGFAFDEGVAASIGHQVFGQAHGQVLLGHGLRAAGVAVNDGDGRAPVALAADTPVAQPPGGFFLAQAAAFKLFGCQQAGDFAEPLAAFFFIPLLLSRIDNERFGMIALAWTLLSYTSALDLGIGRATTQYVSALRGKGDLAQIPPAL